MNKYLKNVKLRLGVLTVEVALIFSLVIVIGQFFLPGNGMMKHVDGIIDVVLGRVTSDTGDYKPSGLWDKQEPPKQDETANNNIIAKGIVLDALKEAFSSDKCTDKEILYRITRVQIAEDGKMKFEINGTMENAEKYFNKGNASTYIMGIINGKEGHEDVKPGIYEVK